MSTELERAPSTRWPNAGGRLEGAGFAACCTPDVTYEDPVAVDLLRGVDALDAHAKRLRDAFPDLRMEATAPPLFAAPTRACRGARSAPTAPTSARRSPPPTAS